MSALVPTPGVVLLTSDQLEDLLQRAAERGAELALEAVKASPAPGLVPASEMARLLNVSRTTLHRLRTEQGAPAVRVGDVYKFEPSAVLAWARERGGAS
ncbi:MAG: helix-turn-helix domain-containing protein [Polyangiaceae bacterium]